MAVEHGILDWSLPVAGDLSTKQFYPVYLQTNGRVNTVASTAQAAFGVLQDDPDAAGRVGAVRTVGISKMIVDGSGTAITPGTALTFGGSGVGVATTTANQPVIGVALESSSAAGDIITVHLAVPGTRY